MKVRVIGMMNLILMMSGMVIGQRDIELIEIRKMMNMRKKMLRMMRRLLNQDLKMM